MNRKERRAAKTGKAAPQPGTSGANLGALWSRALHSYRAGQPAEAEAGFRAILSREPRHGPSWHLLGLIHFGRGDHGTAVACLRRAVAADPSLAPAHNDLGAVLQLQEQGEEAVASYRRAIALVPDYTEAYYNLGCALQEQGRLAEAGEAYHRAIALKPDHAGALNNLGTVLLDQGRLDRAIGHYRQALAAKPDYVAAHSNLLRALNFDEAITPEALLAAHKGWAEAHAPKPATLDLSFSDEPDPERRLRVGYVSADFREHSVSYFFEALLDAHDPAAVEVFCYAEVRRPDAMTARLQAKAEHWLSILGLNDAAAAERIRRDRIDILIDLGGHTANNRLGIFARKPAPVQATWCGYPNTTGLATMDYRITDARADPEGEAERWHTETLVRLPRTFLCYLPPEHAGPVTRLPARQTGTVTFGSFNSLPKATPEVVRLWARILQKVPNSRLLLKALQLRDAGVRTQVIERFVAAGVEKERIEPVSWSAVARDHLALYGRVDVALDPFPYNGTTTTCEALWMGVPVVTLRGDRHAGRVGTSLLTAVGLPELIADTPEAYVDLAVELARDLDRLASLRATLRERVRASALCDAAGFARDMETAYRAMWRRWCSESSR